MTTPRYFILFNSEAQMAKLDFGNWVDVHRDARSNGVYIVDAEQDCAKEAWGKLLKKREKARLELVQKK